MGEMLMVMIPTLKKIMKDGKTWAIAQERAMVPIIAGEGSFS